MHASSEAKGFVASVLALALLAGAPGAQAVGHPGPSLVGCGPTSGDGPTPTESKPESKLWFHDGSWWGSLWSAGAHEFRIQRLNPITHAWVDTGVAVEARPDSHSDALSVGDTLYLATHEFARGAGSPGDALLVLRYHYQAGPRRYTLDPGFPVTIGDTSTETMVIDRDSTGTLWACWKQNLRVWISHTQGSDTSWSAPTVLPGMTSDADSDDVCALIHFGNRIGVMWSDQVLNGYFLTTHLDGAPAGQWSPVDIALAGESDDHIHLAADSAGRLFAVVKNQADEVKLLVRSNGSWQQHLVGAAGAGLTRPIVLLDEEARRIRVFATVGSSIREKTSSLDTISFAPGSGTVVIRDTDGDVNNATSTKQNVSASTGLVVLAGNDTAFGEPPGTYWHHELAPDLGPLTLALAPGVAGVENTLTVGGATPGGLVAFIAALHAGTTHVPLSFCPAGIDLELAAPYFVIGSARADGSGVARLAIAVPAGYANKTFQFEAAEPLGCRTTNRVAETF